MTTVRSSRPAVDPVALLDQQPAGEFVRRPALGFRVGQPVGHSSRSASLRARISRAAGVGLGRDDDLDKDFRDRLGGGGVERAVERDDAAERADRVAGERLVPGLAQARADRGAARVGVLDDRDRRLGEFGDQLVGGVGVGVVVVGQLLALDLARGRDAGTVVAGAVERGALVRVLAVAGLRDERGGADQRLGEGHALVAREPQRDRGVIGGGQRVGLARETPPQRAADPAGSAISPSTVS